MKTIKKENSKLIYIIVLFVSLILHLNCGNNESSENKSKILAKDIIFNIEIKVLYTSGAEQPLPLRAGIRRPFAPAGGISLCHGFCRREEQKPRQFLATFLKLTSLRLSLS